MQPPVRAVSAERANLDIERLPGRDGMRPKVNDARPIVGMQQRVPTVELLDGLAEEVLNLVIDELDATCRGHGVNHARHAVDRQLKIELVCAEDLFGPSELRDLLLQSLVGRGELVQAVAQPRNFIEGRLVYRVCRHGAYLPCVFVPSSVSA